jgi:Uma2 family endonuclease
MVQLLKSPSTDQRVVFPGSWEKFRLIQQASADSPGVRLFYYDRMIEIFMPGEAHETFASVIGYLVMTFLIEKGIAFKPTRAKTQEKEGVASLQADESYCLGGSKPIPDLSIEVVFSSGGTQKLLRYQALGVPEVWFWEDGVLALHHLRTNGYERVDCSEFPELADLDVDLLRRCILIAETNLAEAVSVFRQGIGRD